MQSNLYLLERENEFIRSGKESFKKYLDKINNNQDTNNNIIAVKNEKESKQELDRLDDEIMNLKEKIKQTKLRHKDIQTKRSNLSVNLFQSRQMRDALLDRVNLLTCQQSRVLEEIASLNDDYNRVISNLNKFKQINSINDAFYIWYSGPYATINNFRLGTLPNKPIEWNEINCALGQAALVIHIIASKAGVDFKKYCIVPMGSFPKLVKADDKRTSFPLFLDSGPLIFFPKKNFNLALLGFITCIQELGDFISNYDPTLSLPYKISIPESRIGDLSFSYGTDEELWTRALKFMLSNIKWIIAWYSKHCNSY
eukprot:gene5991-8249_t